MCKVINILDYINKRKWENSMTKKNIEDLAIDTLMDYDILDVPVDPIAISNKLGINVYKSEFNKFNDDTISGAIKKTPINTEIFVNKNDSLQRQRFTIAHELGHYFIHLKDLYDNEFIDMHRTTGYTSNTPEEIEANQFAAALLMPEEKVKELFNTVYSLGFSDEFNIEWLSNKFVVSKSAMKYRLKNLELI